MRLARGRTLSNWTLVACIIVTANLASCPPRLECRHIDQSNITQQRSDLTNEPPGEQAHDRTTPSANEPEQTQASPSSEVESPEGSTGEIGAGETVTEAPSETTTEHDPEKCHKCIQVIKKVLMPIDGSELDHRDYVVSDREYELVLKRLLSETCERRTTEAPNTIKSGAAAAPDPDQPHERTERSIEHQVHLGRKSAPANLQQQQQGQVPVPNECFICLEEFRRAPNDEQGALFMEVTLLCGHKYHLDCLSAWYSAKRPRSTRCPVCISRMRYNDGRLFSDSH